MNDFSVQVATEARIKQVLAASLMAILLSSCGDKHRIETCKAPTKAKAQSMAEARNNGLPDATQADVDSMNASVDLSDCLDREAYAARNLNVPLEYAGKAIMAIRRMSFGTMEYRKVRVPNAKLLDDRAGDVMDEANEALPYVASTESAPWGLPSGNWYGLSKTTSS